jgi:uncharacterized protein YkwD
VIPLRRLQLATATVVVVALFALVLVQGAFGVQKTASVADTAACPGSRSSDVSHAKRRRALICLINHARARVGLRPLSASGALARGALAKGLDVVRCSDFDHDACGQPVFAHVRASGFPYVAAGENLYFAERPVGSALDVFAAWLRSPEHRRLMFVPGFSHAGTAVIEVDQFSGARKVSLWVLQLAQRA